MTTAIKRRRGTTVQHSTFTGLEGELTIDTTKDTVIVHDGAIAGGIPLLREDLANNTAVVTTTGSQTLTNKALNGTLGATTPYTVAATTVTSSALTSGRITYASTGGLLADSANLTFDGTTLFTPNLVLPQTAWTLGTTGANASIVGYGSTGSGGTANTLVFNTNTGERMRLDSSGNLGLGVTPSAWHTNYKSLAINQTGSGMFSGSSSAATIGLLSGAYLDSGGTWRYTVTGQAINQYLQTTNGAHVWFTAPSGTAGNAITFTQAMTLDASGNLGVGRTPVNKLDIGTSFTSQSSTGINASTKSVRISSPEAGVLFTTDINTAGSNSGTQTSSAQVGYVYYSSTFPTDFVIGTNTQTVASNLRFYNNNVEAMRIDASGNFMVGTTTANNNNSTSFAFNIQNGNQFCNHINGTASGTGYIQFIYNGTGIGSITQNGTTGVLYNVVSDRRLKENIVDSPSALSLIGSVKVRSFDFKSDGSHTEFGLIAQEFYEVAPECVNKGDEGEEITDTWGLDASALVPAMIKAIQEQQAMIDELKAKVAALEAA